MADSLPEGYLPLMMGDKLIGKIEINDLGEFSGKLDQEFVDILRETMGAGLQSVSFLGIPSIPAAEAHLAYERYLKDMRDEAEAEQQDVDQATLNSPQA